jgi:hypothetical protein
VRENLEDVGNILNFIDKIQSDSVYNIEQSSPFNGLR